MAAGPPRSRSFDLNASAPFAPLTDEERLAWLRLARSENVGPATFRQLLAHCGSAEAAIEALPGLVARSRSTRSLAVVSRAEAEQELTAAQKLGIRYVGLTEPLYPPWLRHADAPPPLVGVRGSLRHLTSPAVAIVGARNASAAGRRMAAILARALADSGLVIVSGLARGIDAAAHEAALPGGTMAVFAGGLDIVYPTDNIALFKRILEHDGCGISEMRLGWEPRARDFPRRNRIIAGLSLATVVVEAAERSGSLITARLALEQNREVLAVPGSPLDPRAAGSNRLLKQGARLVTDVRDIIEAIAPMMQTPPLPPEVVTHPVGMAEAEFATPETDRAKVIEALGPTPVEVDEIIRCTGVPARAVQAVILELDLAGRLERHPFQRVSWR